MNLDRNCPLPREMTREPHAWADLTVAVFDANLMVDISAARQHLTLAELKSSVVDSPQACGWSAQQPRYPIEL